MKLPLLFFRVFLALAWLLSFGGSSIAQTKISTSEAMRTSAGTAAGPSQDTSGETEGLLHLDVVVTDATGESVRGLEAKDFQVSDNGQPQTILSFRGFDGQSAATDPPVEIIFFIDTVTGSNNPAALYEVGEAAKFLRQNGGRLTRSVSVFGVSDDGLWTLDHPSSDGNAIANDLMHNRQQFLPDSSAHESLRGAPLESLAFRDPPFFKALKALAKIAAEERRKPGRKLLFWIGPGCGIGSGAYPRTAGEGQKTFDLIVWFSMLVSEARMEISTFSVGESDPRSLLYKDYLNGVKTASQANFMYVYKNVLAVESGGQVKPTGGDLLKQMNDCVRDANAYSVSFNPSPAAQKDEFHDLKVKLSRGDLTARTTPGYYAQPYYTDQANPILRRITVAGLQQQLLTARTFSDGEVARQLSNLELTERMSDEKLTSGLAELRGKQARQALTALADQSVFLEPPTDETSSDPPPDQNMQQRMISLTAEYLRSTTPRLPDFYAKRISARYEENPEYKEGSTHVEPQPMHEVEHSQATVLYQNGSEVLEAKAKLHGKQDRYLITYGTFGPLLRAVMDPVVTPGSLSWSRWEKTEGGGNRAVFRYVVSAGRSRYQSGGCCLPDGDGTISFRKQTGYHGEIAIDPANGAVLRLTLQADLGGFVPLSRSDIMIAYSPLEIGSKTCICPVRSVSISRSRSVPTLREWNDEFKTWGPYTTMLNDFAFEDYHMFRGQSRILSYAVPDAAEHDGNSTATPSPTH